MVFTDGDPDDPKPDVLRHSTKLGWHLRLPERQYGRGMHEPYIHRLHSDGSDCRPIGETTVNVYPDSVTLVNIRVSWPEVNASTDDTNDGQ